MPLLADVQQFVVRDAAPQEERQPRRQLEVADAVGAPGGTLCGSSSKRNRNAGSTRMRASACWMPDFEVAARRGPADRTSSASRLRRRCSGAAKGAARERRDDLPRAGRSSLGASPGWQTKMRRRLGVSPAPVALNGPVMTTVWMPPAGVNAASIRKSENWSSTPAAALRSTSAAPIVCGPAVTLIRKLRGVRRRRASRRRA